MKQLDNRSVWKVLPASLCFVYNYTCFRHLLNAHGLPEAAGTE